MQHGDQTIDLACLTSYRITAVDNQKNTPFLAKLQERAIQGNCRAEIATMSGDMVAMDFPPTSFDLIWSEGVAYIMGFKNAINAWRPQVRSKGSMVISMIVWFIKSPPQEVQGVWAGECSDMKYHTDNFPIIEES